MRFTVKSVATSVAALGAIGATAADVTSIASAAASGPADVRLAAVGAPFDPALPQDPVIPAPGQKLPTPDQLSSLCNQATDPGVSYTTKTDLVENGISPDEGHLADHDLRKATGKGSFRRPSR